MYFHIQLFPLYYIYKHFVWKALDKDHHALRRLGSSESYQVLKDEREALVCVDDVV